MDDHLTFDFRRHIRTIPDFPKPGIQFRDITTLMANAAAFAACIKALSAPFHDIKIDFVAGIEARGFILGGPVACELGCGFIPIRKKGKLPGAVISQSYALEYGTDTVEIHADVLPAHSRILIIDDLIATGGTAGAAIDLIRLSGSDVVAVSCVIDLPELGGAQKIRDRAVPVHYLIDYEGE